MKGSVAMLFALVGIGSSQLLQEGNCPEISVVQDFDAVAYSGIWYEIAAYPEVFEQGGECPMAEYAVLDDGTVSVRNTMVVGNLLIYVEGSAYQVGSEGKVVVSFEVNGVKTSSQLKILDTDYTSYAVALTCSDNGDGTRNMSSWILSREKALSAAARASVDVVLQAAEGLEHELFVYKDHSDDACSSDYTAGFD